MAKKILQKKAKLHVLKQRLLADDPVPILASGATQIVFGSGNVDAAVVFVGEAPGKKEDETGQPFVGASGKLLDGLLSGVGLSRESVYITNIVKFRPPDNRDPTPTEKAACWPYLLEQIAIIKPKVVATLGRHSGQVFIPDLRIGADHGKPKECRLAHAEGDIEVTIIPLYHPAAALYNPALRSTLAADINVLATLL